MTAIVVTDEQTDGRTSIDFFCNYMKVPQGNMGPETIFSSTYIHLTQYTLPVMTEGVKKQNQEKIQKCKYFFHFFPSSKKKNIRECFPLSCECECE